MRCGPDTNQKETHPTDACSEDFFSTPPTPARPAFTTKGAACHSWKRGERRRSVMNKKEEMTVCQYNSGRHDTIIDVGKGSIIGVLAHG